MDLRTGVCPLCDHDEAIEAVPNEFGFSGYSATQLAVTHRAEGVDRKRRDYPVGKLMLYVCRKCGHAQWFAATPEKIPIGDDYQTKLIQGRPPQGPFR